MLSYQIKTKRIRLNRQDAQSEFGKELIALLEEIIADKALSLDEFLRLETWCDRSDIPSSASVKYLRTEIARIRAKGCIEQNDCISLLLDIEAILPRKIAIRAPRRAITPTEPQLSYIAALGGILPKNASRTDASELIDSLLNERKSVTNRQMMVLRFWNKTAIAAAGRRAVCVWMDNWYSGNPKRQIAWELWKSENGDTGQQDDPEKVPLGMGSSYLKRVTGHKISGALLLVACFCVLILGLVISNWNSESTSEKPPAIPSLNSQSDSKSAPTSTATATPKSLIAEATPTPSPVATAQPTPTPLPEGKFILLHRVVINTTDGIYGIPPGTIVSESKRQGHRVTIISGTKETVVSDTDLTRDLSNLAAPKVSPTPSLSDKEGTATDVHKK